MKFLFLAFLVVPIVEIYLLISVGSMIGAPWTIFLVVLTAVIGAALVRSQGVATYSRAQTMLQNGEMPAMELMEGLFLLVAGALLMTPGFFTDAIGFACLTPPLRKALIKRGMAAGIVRANAAKARGGDSAGSASQPGGGRVIEGEYRDLDGS